MDELFVAEKGDGAWLGDRKRLRVAGRTHLADAAVVTGIKVTGTEDDARTLRELNRISPAVAGIRRTGSACLDLAWLAAGRFDGMWEGDLKPWDIAAGAVMLREAGGTMSDYQGKPASLANGEVVAGNETIHRHLLKAVQDPR